MGLGFFHLPLGGIMRKVLALLALIASIFTLAACGSSHGGSHDDKRPTTMMGEWRQINASPDGWMTASISGSSIQVNLRSRDYSSIFWMGSFETNQLNHPSGKFKVVSLGDQDAMKWDITASTEKQKTFTYNNGDLSFQYSAMGSSTIVHMSKTKSATVVPTPRRTVTSTPTYKRPMATPTRTTSKPTVKKTPTPRKTSSTKK